MRASVQWPEAIEGAGTEFDNGCVSFCRSDQVFWSDVGCRVEWDAFMGCFAKLSSASELICEGYVFPADGVCERERRAAQNCAAAAVLDGGVPVRAAPALPCSKTVRQPGRTGCTVDFRGSRYTYFLPKGSALGLHVVTGDPARPELFDPSWADQKGLVDVYPSSDGTFDSAFVLAVVRELQIKLSIGSELPVRYSCFGLDCGPLFNGYHPKYLSQAPGPILTVWWKDATATAESLASPLRYPVHFLYTELGTHRRWEGVANYSYDDRSTEYGCGYSLLGHPRSWRGAARDVGEVERAYCNNAGPFRFAAGRVF